MNRTRQGVSISGLAALLILAAGRGSAAPSPPAQSSPTVATATPTAAPTPTAVPTAAATSAQLAAVAAAVYPACHSACQGQGTNYTVCDSGSSSPRWADCPLTARLVTQLQADVQGVPSAAEPLGGGQDPYWATESVTSTPSVSGGVAHVVLGFGNGPSSHTDLVVVATNGQLLVDDLYCTSSNAATADAYAPGWLNRSTCQS